MAKAGRKSKSIKEQIKEVGFDWRRVSDFPSLDNGNKVILLRALVKTMGIISPACDKVKITARTHNNWMNEDKLYNEYYYGISERAVDFSESKLMGNIKDGKEASIMFHLKCKGKKRGYIERVEHDVNANVSHDIDKLSTTELWAELDALKERNNED
jgi:hypothetical protein